MSEQTTKPQSRRAILAAAAGAAAATLAGGLARPAQTLAADGDPLLLGRTNDAPSTTVLDGTLQVTVDGVHDFVGLSSYAAAGQGVVGTTGGNVSWTDCGILGRASGARAAAIVASHTNLGTALYVNGKVQLVRRSGRATVPAGSAHVDVDLGSRGGLKGTPLCFANLMSYQTGAFVTIARPNYPRAGSLRIYLNRTVPSATSVAWLVLN